jgi:hypothetical protein
MLFQPRVNLGRQIVLHEICEEPYEVGTAGLGHVTDSVTRRRIAKIAKIAGIN